MSETLGAWLRVWESGDGIVDVQIGSEHTIDAAVSHYLDTSRDSLLHLTTVSGEAYTTRASSVLSWRTSTPEGRRRTAETDKAERDETQEIRSAVGLPWRDPDAPC